MTASAQLASMKNWTDGKAVTNKSLFLFFMFGFFFIKPNHKDSVNGNLRLLPLSSAKTAGNGNEKDAEKIP